VSGSSENHTVESGRPSAPEVDHERRHLNITLVVGGARRPARYWIRFYPPSINVGYHRIGRLRRDSESVRRFDETGGCAVAPESEGFEGDVQ
jgi:hypothetical protein